MNSQKEFIVLIKQDTFSSFPNILTLPLSWDAVGLWDRLPHEPRKPIQAKGPGGQVA